MMAEYNGEMHIEQGNIFDARSLEQLSKIDACSLEHNNAIRALLGKGGEKAAAPAMQSQIDLAAVYEQAVHSLDPVQLAKFTSNMNRIITVFSNSLSIGKIEDVDSRMKRFAEVNPEQVTKVVKDVAVSFAGSSVENIDWDMIPEKIEDIGTIVSY